MRIILSTESFICKSRGGDKVGSQICFWGSPKDEPMSNQIAVHGAICSSDCFCCSRGHTRMCIFYLNETIKSPGERRNSEYVTDSNEELLSWLTLLLRAPKNERLFYDRGPKCITTSPTQLTIQFGRTYVTECVTNFFTL